MEFNYFNQLEENEQTRKMTIAKVCDIMAWENKTLGFLNNDGFIGIFIGGIRSAAGGITAAIFSGLVVSCFFKAKDKSLTLDLTGEMISQGAKGTSITADGSFSVERPNVILKELGLKPLSSALNIPATGGLSYVSQNGFDSIKNFTVRFGETDSSVAISGSLSREDKDGKLFYTAGIDINHFNTVDWKDLIEAVEKTNLTDANTPDYDLKLNAQKITKGTQTVNDFSLSLSKKADRIIIHTLKAVLDGETNVFATGGSLSQDEQNGWSLIVSGESKNLRTLLSKYINIQKITY